MEAVLLGEGTLESTRRRVEISPERVDPPHVTVSGGMKPQSEAYCGAGISRPAQCTSHCFWWQALPM